MGCRRALIDAAVVLLLLLGSARVAGAGAETLSLRADAEALEALGISLPRLAYHVRVETGATLAGSSSSSTDELRAYVDPTTDGTGVAVTLVGGAAPAGQTDSRVVSLGGVPREGRARVVALAISEMMRSRGAMPAPVPNAGARVTPALPSAAPPPDRSPSPAPPERPSAAPFTAELAGGASWFSKRGTALFEARAAGERRLVGPYWARVDLGVGYGAGADPAGDAVLVLPSIALGVRVRTSAERTIAFGAGPSLEGGVALASGSAASSSSRGFRAEAFTLRAAFEGDVRIRLGAVLSFVVVTSAGAMPRGAELRADDRVVLGASGFALGARGGFVAALP